ncbi:MAG: putative hydro-lyase [Pseudomonadota bacterium]
MLMVVLALIMNSLQQRLPKDPTHGELVGLDGPSVRKFIRSNAYFGHTAGLAAGRLQANLAIMSEEYALEFMIFCQRNPKPCPVSGVSDKGNPMMFTMGKDIDIRTDVPAYNVYRSGLLDETVLDLKDVWQDDFVAFALGCSFTFEHAIMSAGIKLWHVENNKTVPMFRSNIKCVPAGRFSGSTVVSMRSIPKSRVDIAVEISRKYPLAHGAPIHIGNPAEIGIHDIGKPEWGNPAPVNEGEVPVFWACGVTPQVAIERAKVPIVVTHKPGCMLISDIDEFAEDPNLISTL